MSVLIEALCVVSPNIVLDISYPGGTTAFIDEASMLPAIRYAVSDGTLTSVSMFEPSAAELLVERLVSAGVVGAADRQAIEFVFVDMETGPAIPCSWLQTERHPHGFMLGWEASAPRGVVATPGDWNPSSSWRLARADVRDDPERSMPLSGEEGFETFLDLQTGRVDESLGVRSAVVSMNHEGLDNVPSQQAVPGLAHPLQLAQRVLDRVGLPHRIDKSVPSILIPFVCDASVPGPSYTKQTMKIAQTVIVTCESEGRGLVFTTLLPLCVSKDKRQSAVNIIRQVNKLCPQRPIEYDENSGTLAVVTFLKTDATTLSEVDVERAIAHASPVGGECYEVLLEWTLDIEDDLMTIMNLSSFET